MLIAAYRLVHRYQYYADLGAAEDLTQSRTGHETTAEDNTIEVLVCRRKRAMLTLWSTISPADFQLTAQGATGSGMPLRQSLRSINTKYVAHWQTCKRQARQYSGFFVALRQVSKPC